MSSVSSQQEVHPGSKDSMDPRTVGTDALLGDAVQCIVRSTWEKGPNVSSQEGQDTSDDLGMLPQEP